MKTLVLTAVLAAAGAALFATGCTGARGPSPDGSVSVARSPSDATTCSSASARRTPETRKLYRIDFTVSTIAPGKAPATSTYTLNLEDETNGEVRMGSNVPLSASPNGTASARQDVGLSLRASYVPVDENLLLEAQLELSGLQENNAIRKLSLRGSGLLVPGKEALLGIAEDPITHEKLQLTATAQKLR